MILAGENGSDMFVNNCNTSVIPGTTGRDSRTPLAGQTNIFTTSTPWSRIMKRLFTLCGALCLLSLLFAANAFAGYPEDLAAEVALYPGAQIMSAACNTEECNTLFTSQDAPQVILEYYAQALEAKGWTIDTDMQEMAGGMAKTYKREGQDFIVVVMPQGNGMNMVTLAITK